MDGWMEEEEITPGKKRKAKKHKPEKKTAETAHEANKASRSTTGKKQREGKTTTPRTRWSNY